MHETDGALTLLRDLSPGGERRVHLRIAVFVQLVRTDERIDPDGADLGCAGARYDFVAVRKHDGRAVIFVDFRHTDRTLAALMREDPIFKLIPGNVMHEAESGDPAI